jgi:uncharacterized membrane protein
MSKDALEKRPATHSQHSNRERWLRHIRPKAHYDLLNIFIFFLMFSFIGWVYEVALWLLEEGILCNRGSLYGPWIPIYGFGGIAVLLVVNRWRKNPIICFVMIMVICAPIEYLGGQLLWATHHLRYWDYSHQFLNFQGFVCLKSLLDFAVLGTLEIYVIAPALDSLLNKIPRKIRIIVCAVLYALFVGDVAFAYFNPHSGLGITNHL